MLISLTQLSLNFDRGEGQKVQIRHAPAERTTTKFGIRGRVVDVIICVKFYRNRLRGFQAVRGENGGLPLTLAVALTTGQHYRTCTWGRWCTIRNGGMFWLRYDIKCCSLCVCLCCRHRRDIKHCETSLFLSLFTTATESLGMAIYTPTYHAVCLPLPSVRSNVACLPVHTAVCYAVADSLGNLSQFFGHHLLCNL